MPKRMLGGELGRSESLSRVSLEAETTFFHLISVADDFGRYDARRRILLADLFPLREEVTLEALDRWLRELEREGLLVFYEADGRALLYLSGWQTWQRLRDSKPKFPAPPGWAPPQTVNTEEDSDDSRQPAATRRKSPQPAARARAHSESREPRAESREEEEPPKPPAAPIPPNEKQSALDLGPEAERAPLRTLDDAVDAAWPTVREAFAAYGRDLGGKLGEARREALRAAIRENPDRSLTDLVHGYMAHKQGHGIDFDPMRHFDPETVFRRAHRAKYLEAFDREVSAGKRPPFPPTPRAGAAARGNSPQVAARRAPYPRDVWEARAAARAAGGEP